MHYLLASNSPRRKELLKGLEIDFDVVAIPDVDESYPEGLAMEEIPQYIARQKATAYLNHLQEGTLLITADTIVHLEGRVLGKPVDEQDAYDTLRLLSGKTHQVVTGVHLQTIDQAKSFASVTQVTFSELSDEEIWHYIKTYKPFDKAGSYGIQEWIGFVAVSSIQGSYFNVMGLPIHQLYEELKQFNDYETIKTL